MQKSKITLIRQNGSMSRNELGTDCITAMEEIPGLSAKIETETADEVVISFTARENFDRIDDVLFKHGVKRKS